MKKMNALITVLGLAATSYAQAALTITYPATHAALSAKSKLRGACDGNKNVKLAGKGIASGKSISCRKNGYWEYSLENAYPKMPNGIIKITVTQNGRSTSREFTKGQIETPKPDQVDAKNCTINSVLVKSGSSLRFFKDVRVPHDQSCQSEVRKCTDGKLSGSYPFEMCQVDPKPSSPELPPQPETGSDLNANYQPGQNFDLRLWKLTLPVDASGQKTGTAFEIKPLRENYAHPEYFFTKADGAMVFTAPVDGATTSGSKYPRSELREMTANYQNAAWTIEQGGLLQARLAVNEVPKTSSGTGGRVVVGQIHGPNDELNRLYYENGQVYFVDDKAGDQHQETKFYLKSANGAMTQIPLNSLFDYEIRVKNGIQTVTVVHNGTSYVATEKISSFWPRKALYFKAGVYVQVGKSGSGAGVTGSGRGVVSFYKLTAPSH